MTVVGDFSVRGGITTAVTATYVKQGIANWQTALSNEKSSD
jgi:hypothetical protein